MMTYLNCRQTIRTRGGKPLMLAASADLDAIDLTDAAAVINRRLTESWAKYATGNWTKIGLPQWWVADRAFTDLLEEDVS